MSTAPAAIEAERAILGSILVSPETFPGMGIAASEFGVPAHRTIWTTLQRLDEAGKPIDLITVKDDLEARGELRSVGGPTFLAGLLDGVPRSSGAESLDGWRELIQEKARKRTVLAAAERMTAVAMGGESTAVDALDTAMEILQQAATRIGSVVDMDARGQIDEAVRGFEQAGKASVGWKPGLASLDYKLGRLEPGWLVLVGARTGLGKTTLLANMGDAIAAQGGPVVMFSAEMSAREVNQRRLLATAGVPASHFQAEGVTPTADDWERLTRAAGVLADRPFYVVAGAPTPMEARAMARQVKARGSLAAVLFDYLQLFPAGSGRRGETREAEVARVSRALKRLAMDLECVVIAASQINRAPEVQAKPRPPRLTDLRESGAQEMDADVVLLLHRDEGEDEVTQAIVAKHRHRSRNTARLRFDGARYRFTDEYGEAQ